ncbi:MAG: NAD(P)-dependent oxidoreductase [Candidatus Obscuribacterales bacterium]|jgi:nucleoside-diphosphate-sugar epimerase|nr:NAD(P)-dependent oxidoreductase [Candidatus Obscuribacterales bacterium]
MAKSNVLVTGASGMVGFHAVKRLMEKGHEVTALLRPTSDDSKLRQLPIPPRIKRAELSDSAELRNCMQGTDVVIHAAGMVDPHAKREEIFAVNVEGTKNVLSTADLAGAKHFIHISSLSVITGQGDMHGASEEAPLIYCGEAYADSKVDAEKAVTMYFGRTQMMVTILRPGFIYGPHERAWMPRLIENLRKKKAMLIDGGIKQTNVIYVENLNTAIELAMLNPKADKQVFNLTDGETVTKKELFDAICDGMGFERITKEIPGWIAKTACDVVSSIAPMLPESSRKNLSRFSRAAFRLAGVNQGFDITKAENVLGYKDRIPFGEGMRQTLEQFKHEKGAHA